MDSCMNIFRILLENKKFFRQTYSFGVCICYFSQCRLADSMGIQHGGDCVYDFIDDFRTDDGYIFFFAKKPSNIEVEYRTDVWLDQYCSTCEYDYLAYFYWIYRQ